MCPCWRPIGSAGALLLALGVFCCTIVFPCPSCAQELRRSCTVRAHKALATRLLFTLTRCSRLVMSEEGLPGKGGGAGGGAGGGFAAACMTVQPRNRGPGKLRRFSGFPLLRHQVSLDPERIREEAAAAAADGTGSGGGSGAASPRGGSPLLRSSTAPSRSFKEALVGLHHLRLGESAGSRASQPPQTALPLRVAAAPPLSPMPESPSQQRSPASDVSTVSHLAAPRPVGLSPLGRSVVTALEAELEQVAGDGRAAAHTPTNLSWYSQGPPAAAEPAAADSVAAAAESPPVSPSKEKRGLLMQLKQQFRSLTGRRDSGELSDADAASDMSRDSTPDAHSTPRILASKPAAQEPQEGQVCVERIDGLHCFARAAALVAGS